MTTHNTNENFIKDAVYKKWVKYKSCIKNLAYEIKNI